MLAEREGYRAQRDLSRARYDYLLDTLRLKRAAGILTGEDLVRLNRWLTTIKNRANAYSDEFDQ